MDERDAEQSMAGLVEEFLDCGVGVEAWCQRRELVWGGAEGLDLEVDVLGVCGVHDLGGLCAGSRGARLILLPLHGGPPFWIIREGLGVEGNYYIVSLANAPALA
jgi:hypothetical protein